MINADLVTHILSSEDSNETEIELADRLRASIEEIEQLVADVQRLQAQEIVRGDEA